MKDTATLISNFVDRNKLQEEGSVLLFITISRHCYNNTNIHIFINR